MSHLNRVERKVLQRCHLAAITYYCVETRLRILLCILCAEWRGRRGEAEHPSC